MPPEPVTWFVDENNLLLARRLVETRPHVVYPGHPDVPEIPRGTSDEEWLGGFEPRAVMQVRWRR